MMDNVNEIREADSFEANPAGEETSGQPVAEEYRENGDDGGIERPQQDTLGRFAPGNRMAERRKRHGPPPSPVRKAWKELLDDAKGVIASLPESESPKVRLAAAKLVVERAEGAVPQTIKLDADTSPKYAVDDLTDEQLLELLGRLAAHQQPRALPPPETSQNNHNANSIEGGEG